MSDYIKSTNFAAKDALTSGDPNKKVRGTEIDAEFVAIQTAVGTKLDKASPQMTGSPTAPTPSAAESSTIIPTTKWVRDLLNAYEPLGTIKAFAGTLATIPAGWAICNGTNGTVNLSDRFIIGAGGTFAQNSSGGTAGSSISYSLSTDAQGVHQHGGVTAGTALSVAQLPPHDHGSTPLYSGTGATGYINSTVAAYPLSSGPVTTGSGQTHNHGVFADGAHTHTVIGTINLPAWFALAFIQKIALL